MSLRVRGTLLGISGALMLLALYLVFFWVPTDANLGVSQRIFYFHVPIAFMGLLAIGVIFVASVRYLFHPSPRWDALAYAAAEVGLVFATLILVTGSIWAKPVWGVWWTWSPQLTLSLILWFIYVGYLMLRAYGPKGTTGGRYAAILGIIGFVDAPIVYMSAKWWRDLHPERIVGPLAEPGALDDSMRTAWYVAILAFAFLFTYLIAERYALRRIEEETEGMSYLHA
ncbi:MAG: cytochrome c biogenesis protein CcsA [Chloroflexi bacterium]|nr:cytochrome c biogenesis protein CcsA [Chloroflexota bacterium]